MTQIRRALALLAFFAFAAVAPRAATAAAPPDLAQLLPGVAIPAEMSPAQREVLARIAQESFCHCGCPHTLSGCLKEHKTCKHSGRMATLATRLVMAANLQAGTQKAASDIQSVLTQHYAGFDAKKRANLNVKDFGPPLGNADAPITLVEYSDFTCPFCQQLRPKLEAFVEKHAGRVKLYYKPFPLPASMRGHERAWEAAEAAEFARANGKFWQMHDLLFENARELSDDDLAGYATKLGLDPTALREALASKKFRPRILASQAEARIAGLTGTPTVFVNGRRHVLDWSDETLEQTIAEEEEWMKNKGWAKD
ncbi:MAG TPA: thioredoxin domain-containing protein [Anaeromyxobacteraceae bacterium]|nr:thioredoxin domain-containing protein [Anaeromyxobacteraceae bacterium]